MHIIIGNYRCVSDTGSTDMVHDSVVNNTYSGAVHQSYMYGKTTLVDCDGPRMELNNLSLQVQYRDTSNASTHRLTDTYIH